MTSPTSSAAAGSRLVLAVSISGPGGALALADHARVLDEIAWTERATASELATVRLTELLGRGGVRLTDLTHVLVNTGPGSFTGVRVALNLARALAYALPRPIASIDALTILGQKFVPDGERRVIALKAVRNHYYVADFARDEGRLRCLAPPRSLAREQIPPTDVLIEGESAGFDPVPRASDLARAWLDQPDLADFSVDTVKPLYVRGSEAEEKLRK